MPELIVSKALLPGGWAKQVLLSMDETGHLSAVRPDAAPTPSCERVDGVALPGVPNLHSHAFQRALAGLTEERTPRGGKAGDTFWSWRERMYGFLARLGPEQVEAIATWLMIEMLRAGYTAVGEFHYLQHDPGGRPYPDRGEMARRIEAAASTAGIGLTLLPAVYTSGDFGGAPPSERQRRFLLGLDDALALLEELRPLFGPDTAVKGGARRVGLALHSLRAVPAEAASRAAEQAWALDPNCPIHVHAAEQRREVDGCLAWSGRRPVQWLLDHAPVDRRWCLVHATHMDPEETARLAATGAVAGLCPTTEANLGDGLFPLGAWLGEGGSFGVGSDSHVSVSPVEELRWLEYGQRLRGEERNVAGGHPHPSTGRSLFEAAVAGGARALGLEAGALAPGLRADLVVLDPEHPVLAGRRDDRVLDAWIFSGNDSPVRHVMVGGRWVVRDGRHAREKEARERYRSVVEVLAESG